MDLARLWDAVLEAMCARIGHTEVEIWLRKSKLLGLDVHQGIARVQVDNRYYRDWIKENYEDELREAIHTVCERPVLVEFTWPDDMVPQPIPAREVAGEEPRIDGRAHGVTPGQTFENFVIGECNKFAHAAAYAVAQHPAAQYNPLFIYGSTGLGKTHLMHAVANRVLASDAEARVVYVTSETFMNEMVTGIQYKRMEDFREKYRSRADILLVDDVQFIAGKERTQEEFFHMFNDLILKGRQIVLTSDVPPKDIDQLEPRLRTRFEGGLLADMQAPDPETLHAILRQKADSHRLHIPNDLANSIAELVEGNIRELEGVLNRILALHTFYNEPITLEWARHRLPDVFDPPKPTITAATIIEAVARFHNLRSADITGKKRTRNLTRPRHIAMYLAREHTGLSYPELGREFGGRDHSTIQHGCKKVADEMSDNPDFQYRVRLIEQTLNVRPSRRI